MGFRECRGQGIMGFCESSCELYIPHEPALQDIITSLALDTETVCLLISALISSGHSPQKILTGVLSPITDGLPRPPNSNRDESKRHGDS